MAAPILECRTGTDQASALLATSGLTSIETGRQVVTDCPADAWDESDQQAIRDLRDTFGDDLVDTHESELSRAGHQLIETHLRAEWRKRGFGVAFTNYATTDPGSDIYATTDPGSDIYAVPSDEVCHQVWQAAADAITDRDLVLEAGLGHVFPFSTELEMHRAALLHRLNEVAATFDDSTCENAWQLLDGLRAAVDTAVIRAQLIEVSARADQLVTRIPAPERFRIGTHTRATKGRTRSRTR